MNRVPEQYRHSVEITTKYRIWLCISLKKLSHISGKFRAAVETKVVSPSENVTSMTLAGVDCLE
jgi:hypothetical protein